MNGPITWHDLLLRISNMICCGWPHEYSRLPCFLARSSSACSLLIGTLAQKAHQKHAMVYIDGGADDQDEARNRQCEPDDVSDLKPAHRLEMYPNVKWRPHPQQWFKPLLIQRILAWKHRRFRDRAAVVSSSPANLTIENLGAINQGEQRLRVDGQPGEGP